MEVLPALVGQSRPDLPSPRSEAPCPPPWNRWPLKTRPSGPTQYKVAEGERPAKGWTAPGAAGARAMRRLGAMYRPVRVRVLTAMGRVQFRVLPSGAVTRNGRYAPALLGTAGESMHLSG